MIMETTEDIDTHMDEVDIDQEENEELVSDIEDESNKFKLFFIRRFLTEKKYQHACYEIKNGGYLETCNWYKYKGLEGRNFFIPVLS